MRAPPPPPPAGSDPTGDILRFALENRHRVVKVEIHNPSEIFTENGRKVRRPTGEQFITIRLVPQAKPRTAPPQPRRTTRPVPVLNFPAARPDGQGTLPQT